MTVFEETLEDLENQLSGNLIKFEGVLIDETLLSIEYLKKLLEVLDV